MSNPEAAFGHNFTTWKMRVDEDLKSIRAELRELRSELGNVRIEAAQRGAKAEVQADLITEMAAREGAMLDRLNGIDGTLGRLATAIEGLNARAPIMTASEGRGIVMAIITALCVSGATWLVAHELGFV